ncbi:Rho termination factor, N-terminal domain [Cyclobacterium lianum]|uniref:Rho termination factor, N-terminal domain n=1 Tax=Cyclobacterium lianum TaxID=388280 RepID=A0A1M7LK90_9BACT|nr:Rho termination factor N-terminal domain-containing protein [Cyclobacterium lianum]SHM78590.1 Rho termination factor, N-terminal domain [Cyclobacterium lianum]
MSKNKRPQIKNEEQYEALKDQGYSKEKAARIANTPDEKAGKKGGKAPAYEEWTKDELYKKAQKIGLSGISKLRKDELIAKLRSH